MRFQRVLLVSPPTSSYLGAARPPQNLGYLARALLDRGIAYDILDMRLGYQIKHLNQKSGPSIRISSVYRLSRWNTEEHMPCSNGYEKHSRM